MKKFILSLFFVIFALFNVCGEDLLHPVIRDDIDEDIKKIEQALVDYVFYPELVERGFDVHQLDNMKIDGEMFEYIESFFRPNEEKGWLPLDNHHSMSIKDENGKWFSSQSYKRRVIFTNEYGTTATNTLESNVNIAESPIDVYVQVKQTAKSRFKSTGGFDVTIAATALTATIEGVTYTTGVPSIVASAAGAAVVNAINNQKNDFTSTKKSAANGTVVFTVAYPTGAPVPADTEVGTIQFQWPATDGLAVGSYSATITMSYTAP